VSHNTELLDLPVTYGKSHPSEVVGVLIVSEVLARVCVCMFVRTDKFQELRFAPISTILLFYFSVKVCVCARVCLCVVKMNTVDEMILPILRQVGWYVCFLCVFVYVCMCVSCVCVFFFFV